MARWRNILFLVILIICVAPLSFFFTYMVDRSIRRHRLHGSLHLHSHDELDELDELDDFPRPKVPVPMHSQHEAHHAGESKIADQLKEKVRVVCWVMTQPKNHNTRVKDIIATWGKRCTKLVFISSEDDPSLGIVKLNISEGRDFLWGKTKGAFKYAHDKLIDEGDWFMKADDDTYVVLENLRYMLSAYNPNESIWFGCRAKPYVKEGYMSGGAGYILSRSALKKFVTEAMTNSSVCRPDEHGAEDVEMGKCLMNVGVHAVDSRDGLGRGRFFPFVPEHHLFPGIIDPNHWFWNWIYYPTHMGQDCCSDTAITFHYISPTKMYELEYLIYHLRPYGISHNDPYPPPLPPDKTHIPDEVIDRYLDQQESEKGHESDNKPNPSGDSISNTMGEKP
ncbi:glycoprotein-N-acetylgalactosamine 3-beta-galactosyltransferase 1-like [Oratosquilla oratoria]|uniref:glycoprotein-N-acetylgalactosamine 3-beta-galactosyltransferase 1-like n=1 Tax=Oratosquilla oratoria TaxID=337810 RepID=UPI003F75DDEB